MARISKKEKSGTLYRALTSLKTEDEFFSFFQDLCTVTEMRAMEQRFDVAVMLERGIVYSEILERTGASSATVSRVNRSLAEGHGGYRKVFERMPLPEKKS